MNKPLCLFNAKQMNLHASVHLAEHNPHRECINNEDEINLFSVKHRAINVTMLSESGEQHY